MEKPRVKNFIEEVEKTIGENDLKQNLLKCVTIDGGKNMCEAELLVGQICKVCKKVRSLRPLVY